MTLGFRCCQPAHRPHPASLPIRVATVASLLRASFGFAFGLPSATPCVSLRLSSSTPSSSFHLDRLYPCWAHWRRLSSLLSRESSRLFLVADNPKLITTCEPEPP